MSGKARMISRIKELDDRLDVVQPDAADQWRMAIAEELDGLLRDDKHVLEHPGRAWPFIHSIEDRINTHDTRLSHLAIEVEHHLDKQPPGARKAAAEKFKRMRDASVGDTTKTLEALEEARKIIRDTHTRESEKYDSARRTRDGLALASGGLFLIAIAAVIAQAFSDEALVPLPENSTLNSSLFLVLLLGAGALGGMLSAVFSLYLPKQVRDTSWFDPRPALAWTKVSVGAWASVIAAVAVGTGAVVGKYTTVAAALLIGVAFGYAQQAITGLLDKYAVGMTEKDPAKA